MPAVRLRYEEIQEKFQSHGCILLISSDEFEKIKGDIYQYKFTFTASCSHERCTSLNSIKNCNSELWICIICARENNKKFCMERYKINTAANHNEEYKSYLILTDILKEKFIVQRLGPSTTADFIVKPIDMIYDLWLRIQIKSTSKIKNNTYEFSKGTSDYTGMVMACVCNSDKKVWFVDYLVLKNVKGKFSITDKLNTKYGKYKCESNEVCDKILEFYEDDYTYPKVDFITADTPSGSKLQMERAYTRLRERNLSFLQFINNDIEGQVYDFKINNYKIQEKGTNTKIEKRFMFGLKKNNGSKNDQPYEHGDNDFYMFHINDNRYFYIIPESELIEHKYVTTDKQKGKVVIYLYPHTSDEEFSQMNKRYQMAWANQYLFDYENLDKHRIIDMFS